MNEEAQEGDRLIDEAIDLVIRLQNDPTNPVPAEMARAWRARSALHEKVWSRLARVHGASGRVLADQEKARRRAARGLKRRDIVIGGLAAAGMIGAGAYVVPRALVKARADFSTGTGEIRRVELPDGSVATLGPDSAIALAFGQTRRQVELLAGMSFFDVAKDAARAFMVRSGDFAVTALGTGFDLSSDAGIVTLGVDHGIVEARAPGTVLADGQRLEAGEWLSFDAASGAIDQGRREEGQIAAWRDSMIIAERETVSALVARIGRWLPGRIVMADPFVGSQRVSGVYDLKDPIRALQAVVHPAGARVRLISSYVTVISPL